MQLIDPSAPSPTQNHQLAPRLTSLQNMRIGLLCNGKANARPLLLKTAELFRRHDQCEIVSDMIFKTNASAPAEDGVIADLAARSDFLITANGDWGSCSTCSLHDGIIYEQFGKPAVVLCTTPFEVTARNIARMLGLPDYSFALLKHPLGSCTEQQIEGRAADAYQQAKRILLAE